MWLPTSIATLLILGGGVEVHSSSECPSSAAIVSSLGLLVSGSGAGDIAWVDVTAQAPDGTTELQLRLQRPDASIVGERRLIVRGGCDEMADTVATVLAAWQAPPVAAQSAAATRAEPVREAARSPLQAWLGAAAGMGVVGGIAATGALELLAGRATSRVRARVAALTQTRRQLDLGAGTVSWRRTHAELGLGWQSHGPGGGSYWQASADADVLLGWVRAAGRGFLQNEHEDAFEWGLGAGVRGERKLGAWAFWLEARTDLWPQAQRAVLTESDSVARLPRFDVRVTFGVSRMVVR